MNEFDLITSLFARGSRPGECPDAAGNGVQLGIGDDCAMLRYGSTTLAVSSDLLIEGRHFFAGTPAELVGHKALAVNLSDLAAMGAVPRGFTLSIALPRVDEPWLRAFCRGLHALADEHRCPLVGGDTTRGPLVIGITVLGEVDVARALRRDGARVDDDVWVSGELGGAAWTVAQRMTAAQAGDSGSVPAPKAVQGASRRLDRPEPRLQLGRSLLGIASAAIDLSDGLAGDLGHVLNASGRACGMPLGAELEAVCIPFDPVLADASDERRIALGLQGGDDYELLFTVPAALRGSVQALRPGVALTRIGRVRHGAGIDLRCARAGVRPVAARGFDHFRVA